MKGNKRIYFYTNFKKMFFRFFAFQFLLIFYPIFFSNCFIYAQSEAVGKEKHLIFHDIKTNNKGEILPWYANDPGVSYNNVINLAWEYWKNIPGHWIRGKTDKTIYPAWRRELPFPPKYLIFRTLEDKGVGGDQFAQMLSSWNLYYDYSGKEEVQNNMVFQADWYLKYGLSKPSDAWPNIPYPCNLTEAPVYEGDLILGEGVTQPDKAGSFGAELIMLYKKTENPLYLEAAIKIANTLAEHTKPGDYDHSPLPFKVNAVTGEIKTTYTSNWTGTLLLFENLIALQKGNILLYQQSHTQISEWLKKFPIENNRWGPFFEDIPMWSDTEINEGQMAWYILTHPKWSDKGLQQVRKMQNWAINTLGINHWKKYGISVMGEQSVYKMQGQSHTSRHASIELLYAKLSHNDSLKNEAVRQLNFCTYAMDNDGKCRWMSFDTYEIWWTDGYGDFVRHFIRSMDASPELAPYENHVLSSTSVLQKVIYQKPNDKTSETSLIVSYKAFDKEGTEKIRLIQKPSKITLDNKELRIATATNQEGYSWIDMEKGGLLIINRVNGKNIMIFN